MAKVKEIISRQILDSRGCPTIEAKLTLDNGLYVTAVASSGESRGKYEGIELRDHKENYFNGLSVLKSVSYINELISPKLKGVDVLRHTDIDFWLLKADNTKKYEVLGVNTLSVISQLFIKAAALSQNIPLYKYINYFYNKNFKRNNIISRVPSGIFCLINGSKHGSKNLDFQEFQVVPSTANTFSKSLEIAVESYFSLKKILDYRNAGISVSDEGGFSPNLLTNTDALDVIKETLVQKKLILGVDVFLGIDAASSDYFIGDKYNIKDKPNPLKTDEYIDYIKTITSDYSILILEDVINEDDSESWIKLNNQIGNESYVIADDFVAGDNEKLKKAVTDKSISGVLLKFNQTATITELLQTINIAQNSNLKVVISQRLGESNDTILSDIAVGVQADFVKFGAPVRGERVAKYNRLLEIESEIISQKK